MRGRKPIPTKLKVLTGNPGKKRLPQGEPEPSPGVPDVPPCLDEYAKEEWDERADALAALGVVTEVDMAALAAYCASYSRWRHAEEALQARVDSAGGNPLVGMVDVTKAGNVIQNALVGIANKAAADMVRYAAELGMTPSARARLAVDPNRGAKGKFDGLIGKGRKNG